MANRIKEKLTSGEVVFGAQLRFGSPAIAELFGHAGFDYVVFDTEHAPQTPMGVQQQIQALGATPATPIVRMLKNDPDLMRPYLDMGAVGEPVPLGFAPERGLFVLATGGVVAVGRQTLALLSPGACELRVWQGELPGCVGPLAAPDEDALYVVHKELHRVTWSETQRRGGEH